MVSYCDLCGSEIVGRAILVEVDKAILSLCPSCARTFVVDGKRIRMLSSSEERTQQKTTARITRPRVARRVEYEVVENYAELIKSARESMGLSRDALARAVGVKESVLRRIEAGQLVPDPNLARKLERVLGIKLLAPAGIEGGDFSVGSSRVELTLGDVVELRED